MIIPWREITQRAGGEMACAMDWKESQPVSGGCIHQSYAVDTSAGRWFVKVNDNRFESVLIAEYNGLKLLSRSQTIRVPNPTACFIFQGKTYFWMEFLPLQSGNDQSWRKMGEAVALLHQSKGDLFGGVEDNHIGTTRQRNHSCSSWVDFFRENRLKYLLNLLEKRGVVFRGVGKFLDTLENYLEPLPSQAALLHGDMWSGNVGFLPKGIPVVYDPAVYYGDPEADIAMTRLFGSFPTEFYRSYHEVMPLRENAESRAMVYNLYHLLNHALLFGSSYVGSSQQMIDTLLSR